MELITTDIPAKEAGEAISNLLKNHAGDTLCLLSGGSALDVVEHVKRNDESECRTIFMMGDERGSRESEINNFLQLESQYQDHWVTENCLRTVLEENETLEEFSTRISRQLDEALAELRDPQVIHLMGMGGDGHTAGIFPLEEDRFHTCYERDQSIVPIHLEGLKIDSRASVTPGWILTHVDHVIGYITGGSKYTTLESLVRDTKAVHERPAELWKLKSGTEVYTDLRITT
jgi:6-phosphogluconolactonase/glucosamine-6-phosphate isomerase/deaminase